MMAKALLGRRSRVKFLRIIDSRAMHENSAGTHTRVRINE